MPRRVTRLDPENIPTHRFAQALREVHRRAGKPTREDLGKAMKCSHATVSHILNGDRFPSWRLASALISACGEDPEQLRPLWLEIDDVLERAPHVPKAYSVLPDASYIMPIYLVCDTSASTGTGRLQALVHALRLLYDDVTVDPLVASMAWLSIITFNDHARVVVPLAPAEDMPTIPDLPASGPLNYGPVFRLLRQTIDDDVLRLKMNGSRVWRPVVFFIIGRNPGDHFDDWSSDLQVLIEPSWPRHPNIFTFGIDGVSEDVLRTIATAKAFKAKSMQTPVAALGEFMKSLTRSISMSAPTPLGDATVGFALFDEELALI